MSIKHRRVDYPTVTMDDIRVGSVVRIKSREWYETNKNDEGAIRCGGTVFIAQMRSLLGEEIEVDQIMYKDGKSVKFKSSICGWSFTPEMVEYVVKY